MNIAHVLTFVSEDGAYGGPLAVAVAQTQQLARMGHNVELFHGWDGAVDLSVPGVTMHPFRTRRVGPGFGGLIAPGLVAALRASAEHLDVVHIHYGRDLIAASAERAARLLGVPVVLQPHGMVSPDLRLRSRVFDYVFTRPAMRYASQVLALGDSEELKLSLVSGEARLLKLVNGVPTPERTRGERRDVVVFVARLHPRKRVLDFIDAAHQLVARGHTQQFDIYGPDEGDLQEARRRIAAGPGKDRIVYRGPLAPGASVDILRSALVFVLPSRGEVFPMTVLEAMSAGCAVVLSHDSEISATLDTRGAAAVYKGGATELARAIADTLNSHERRARMIDAAHSLLKSDWSIEFVAKKLERIYRDAAIKSGTLGSK